MRKFGKLRTFLSIFPREKFGKCKKVLSISAREKLEKLLNVFDNFFFAKNLEIAQRFCQIFPCKNKIFEFVPVRPGSKRFIFSKNISKFVFMLF